VIAYFSNVVAYNLLNQQPILSITQRAIQRVTDTWTVKLLYPLIAYTNLLSTGQIYLNYM